MLDDQRDGGKDWHFDCLLEQLLSNLLKFRIQRGFRTPVWGRQIELLKMKIADLLDEDRWLNVRLMHKFSKIYHYARLQSMIETGFNDSAFPVTCPWRVQDIIRVDLFQI